MRNNLRDEEIDDVENSGMINVSQALHKFRN